MAADGGHVPPEPAEPVDFIAGAAAAPSRTSGRLGNAGALCGSALPKLERPLGSSQRPEENGVKLVNLLNPNNPQYDQAFALEYAHMK